MTTWTALDTYVFSGLANGTLPAPTTSASPSTGQAWTDVHGGVWSVAGGQLKCVTDTINANTYQRDFLLAGSSTDEQDQRIVLLYPAAASSSVATNPFAALRYQRTAPSGGAIGNCYLLGFSSANNGGGSVSIYAMTGSSQSPSQIGATVNLTAAYNYTHNYQIDCSAVGVNPTTLAIIVTDTTTSTVVANLSVTDSTASLQNVSAMALDAGVPVSTPNTSYYSQFTSYTDATSAAATSYTLTGPSSGTIGVASTAFTVTPNGAAGTATTITPSDSSGGGTFMPAAVTFAAGSSAAQTFTYTPANTGARTISTTNSASLINPATLTYTANAASSTLAIGTLTATSSPSGITLSLSAALSGGAGSGYSYKIYRGTDPNFTVGGVTLLATVSSLPYTDSSAGPGIAYFYGVVGSDSAGTTISAIPAGIGAWTPVYTPYVAAQLQATAMNIVFAGDSITYGAGVSNAGTVSSPTMPYFCMTKLKRLLGIRSIYGSNQGHSGHTLTDYAPGGSDYSAAKSAMNTLIAATANAVNIFSLMLGTNDSAQSGTNNSPYTGSLTAAQYSTKLQALVSQMLVDFPACKVFIHLPPWYSPNTQNSANYQQPGLSALYSYRAATATVVTGYAATNPGQVFLGDTYAFSYFAQNYQVEQQADTSGPNGSFYLHPAGTAGSNGLIGTQTLGEMHAQAIAGALLGGIANRWTH